VIAARVPRLVAIGGTRAAASSTEAALRTAAAEAKAWGAEVEAFAGDAIATLPFFEPTATPTREAEAMLEAIAGADGVLIVSPGYHGSVSGLVKNALDYIEWRAGDPVRPYLHGLPVGLIVTSYGSQAGMATLSTLRTIVHSLRGWPTPYGATINTQTDPLGGGRAMPESVLASIRVTVDQVCEMASMRIRADARGI
jgi:FMN reductase